MEVGNNEIIRKLAVGGMAEIFLARHRAAGGFERNVVLKRILPECARDPQFVQAFLNEAKLTAQLSHPNLVQVFDFGQDAGAYYLTMEYIPGFDLEALLRISPRGLPLSVVLSVGRDIAAGLHHAHEARDADGVPLGIIHRDISPDNVLVNLEGVAKIVDFGVAKATAQVGQRTATGQVKGKAPYLAPEQVLGLSLDRRVDVFALGVTLYECVSGQSPFLGGTDFESLTNVVEKDAPLLPGPIGGVIAQALSKERSARFQTCAEMATALEAVAVSAKVAISTAPLREMLAARKIELEIAAEHRRAARAELLERADTHLDLDVPSGMRPKSPTAKLRAREGGSRELWIAVALVAVALVSSVALWRWRSRAPSAVAASVAAPPPVSTPVAPVPSAALPIVPAHPLLVHANKPSPPKPLPPTVVKGEGRLRLVVQPYGSLQIDGREVGDIPRPPDTLAAGAHTLVISNAELGKKVTRKIVINPGEEVLIRENLLEH